MESIINNQMQQGQQQSNVVPMQTGQPQQDPNAQQQQQQAGQPESNEPTPEEQQDYEKVVFAASKILYEDDKTHKGIMKMLKQGKDTPGKTIGHIAAMVITQIDQQSGGKIPETVILPAAAEILGLVAELAQESGTFQTDENVMGRATQQMIVTVAEQYDVSPEELQALIESIDPAEREQMVAQQEQYANLEQPQASAA